MTTNEHAILVRCGRLLECAVRDSKDLLLAVLIVCVQSTRWMGKRVAKVRGTSSTLIHCCVLSGTEDDNMSWHDATEIVASMCTLGPRYPSTKIRATQFVAEEGEEDSSIDGSLDSAPCHHVVDTRALVWVRLVLFGGGVLCATA